MVTMRSTAGPTAPTSAARCRWRPIESGGGGYRLDEGLLGAVQARNGAVAVREGAKQLERAGNLHNLALAAGEATGGYRGPLYLDSDVYKWLEAAAWEQARMPDPALYDLQEEISHLVARAQDRDGYLNSYVQSGNAGRYEDLSFGHELFCGGHLIQGAVAQHRATGSRTLFDVAVRYADHLVATFGPGLLESTDGHPEVEMALVELHRETGRREYLDLARFFVEVRGRGQLETPQFGPDYYQDDRPYAQAPYMRGHAVRAVFLAAGATDVALESGDDTMLRGAIAQWEDMVESKTYLTGGIGSRWEGESFGNPFELGSEVAYAETCAAHGSILWSWRLLLATGDARYAELIERTLYNGFLSGFGADGRSFFYVNTLQARPGPANSSRRSALRGRQPWFHTACCPPNVMRMVASLGHYVATRDDGGVQLHLYAAGELSAMTAHGALDLVVRTDSPHGGTVRIEVLTAPAEPVSISLRIPHWTPAATISTRGVVEQAEPSSYHTLTRAWRPHEVIVLELDDAPRITRADSRIDAIGSAAALERGPLVYCFEQQDQAIGLDDVLLRPGASPTDRWQPDLLGGVHTLHVEGLGVTRPDRSGRLPYGSEADLAPTAVTPTELVGVPYYAWANRGTGAMRVFLPLASGASGGTDRSPTAV